MYKHSFSNPRRGGSGVDVVWGRLRRPGPGHLISHPGRGGSGVAGWWGRLRRPGARTRFLGKGHLIPFLGIMLLTLLLTACTGPFSSATPTPTSTTTTGVGTPAFPTTGPTLRTPTFGTP